MTNSAPRTSHADRSVEDTVLGGVSEKLSHKYGGDDGPLSDDEVEEAVRDAADSLRDAPVQTFVPLIAENKARDSLKERVERQADDEKGVRKD
jgi:hypothetical protein